MSIMHLGLAALFGRARRGGSAHPRAGRRRRRLVPRPEALERRLALDGSVTTYTWTGLGDGTSFNDPENWSHYGPYGGVGVTGVPVENSNLDFPPISELPSGSPTTINFNSSYGSFPVGILTINDSYTFTGNGVTVNNGIIVANPQFRNPTDATLLISNVSLNRQATIYTETNSTLNLGDADDLTGLQLVLQGGVTKGGGGQLVVDTQSINAPRMGFTLQTFAVAGGTVTMGTSTDFSNALFQVDPGASLQVDDDAAVQVGSLAGGGVVDLDGTTAAGDTTALTAFTPVDESDQFTGSINGLGTLAMDGNGTLTLGGVDFGDAGSIEAMLGTLDVDGPISAGTLQATGGTFGGVGSWHFSGEAVFGPNSAFDLTLDGLTPGMQSTQLVSADSTTGIDLGNSTLEGTVNYEYQAGDAFTIATGPLVQGAFQNAANGLVLLGGNVPFSVSYTGTAVILVAQQSETTTSLSSSGSPSHPGQAVTFTATVSTRTAPVSGGTVSFEQGGTVLATEPVGGSGTSTFTTTSLPLGAATITAVYNGYSNVLGSTSGALTQDVVPYTTSTTVGGTPDPSRSGQPVTLIATVVADGSSVTAGTVTFVRGSKLLGRAAVGAGGTASITVSSLPQGDVRIQAVYSGTADDYGSTSPIYVQAVDRFGTATTLTAAAETRPDGKVREVLEAAVVAVGVTGVTPTGVVVFKRDGRAIGQARLIGGTATLVLAARIPARGRFVASFTGGAKYGASKSTPLTLPS